MKNDVRKMAEIFIDEIEKTIDKKAVPKNYIYWYKYVYDIRTCFLDTERQLNTFVYFNK